MSVRWQSDPKTCSHSNDDVCPTCDHDGYYAKTYPDCPWRETTGDLTRCGTYVGYLTHRKRGEKACAPCKAANARRSLIRSRALNLLQKSHPIEFQMLAEQVESELYASKEGQ